MEYISGVVERITFENEDNGFSVIKIKSNGYADLVTVVGSLTAVNVGLIICLKGEWKMDSKFGKQFAAQDYHGTLPATVVGIPQ
ncbi:recD3 domain protein [Desulfosporosinus sp. OT]|nr:recD3 domain protein [Desulfosporosinus sp. OT]